MRYLQLTVVHCKRNNWVERKIGGQPGHVKHERPPFTPEQIDRIVRHDQKPYAALAPHAKVAGGKLKITVPPYTVTLEGA